MDWDDALLDQTPAEERRRQQKMARKLKLPREDVVGITEGSPGYRCVATTINVAGEDIIIMAKSGSALMIAHQKLTNFADFRVGLVHKAVLVAARDVEIDDEL